MLFAITNKICYKQNVETLVWLGENVLEGLSFVVSSDGVVGPDAVHLWVIYNDMSTVSY